MKRINFTFILLVFLFLCYTPAFLFSQDKPKLGILPFTGGNIEDGETIARLFSYQSDIINTFIVVPRNSAVNAIIAEQNFQMSGYTDSDTIVKIGRMLNVDYVVSGHIRRLGNSNLIITTIIDVESFEQLTGNYYTYNKIEDVSKMSLVKGNMYRKADFGITYPKSLVASQTVDGEDYIFFTIECDYNNELSSSGIIIEPYSIDEVVYKDTVPRRTSHVFVRNEPRGAFKYIGDIDVIKPHDARRNLVVVK